MLACLHNPLYPVATVLALRFIDRTDEAQAPTGAKGEEIQVFHGRVFWSSASDRSVRPREPPRVKRTLCTQNAVFTTGALLADWDDVT